MLITSQRITIIRLRRPLSKNINDELHWLGHSLGLFGSRDRDKSCFRLFIELLKQAHNEEGLTSDSLAEKLALSRGTVVHHLRKLQESGIVIAQNNRYLLRVSDLETLVEEVNYDIDRTFEALTEMARAIDKEIELDIPQK